MLGTASNNLDSLDLCKVLLVSNCDKGDVFSEDDIESLSDDDRRGLAEQRKKEGNDLFAKKFFQAAIAKYSLAIRLSPEACHIFYGNRSVNTLIGRKN